jgi:hypothetical protein
MTANHDDLEDAYERLAAGIDAVGANKESLFLARLTMLLAHHLADRTKFAACVDAALQDLATSARPDRSDCGQT